VTRLLAPVLNVRVRTETDDARRDIVNATETARPGALIRLTVGSNRPPMWLADSIRRDLVYQVVAASPSVVEAWQLALKGIA
jgi:hypothetical protein